VRDRGIEQPRLDSVNALVKSNRSGAADDANDERESKEATG
jgi:hypothetical protein